MKAIFICFLTAILAFTLSTSFGWVYPEHRSIALKAIQNLSPEHRAILDRMWAEARKGYEGRLTESIIDVGQGIKPDKLDYASWAAISGDHSCSPELMLQNVLQTSWILDVANIAAQLDLDIRNSRNKSEHSNAIRNSDIKLQRADAEYATRAGSNNVHFLLARTGVDMTTEEYLKACLEPKAPMNALGAYSWFHFSAMQKAGKYARGGLTPEENSALLLSALADEAFALHFLEDVYAAGHTAGTWGVTAVRKGTHDYYNEKGLEVVTWDGKHAILMGDAYGRPEDFEFASGSVSLSLSQLIGAATGKHRLSLKKGIVNLQNLPDTLNVCKYNVIPTRSKTHEGITGDIEDLGFLADILLKTPVPGLATGLGEIPRFRSELGMFLGVSSSINFSNISNGFGTLQENPGWVGGIEANVRAGLGLDGVLNDAGDGLVFFQLGLRQDASSSQNFNGSTTSIPAGAISSAIPGRAGIDMRFRLPFWLIPGDLLFAAPIVYLISKKTATAMGVAAVNGGAIAWQSGIHTSIGRFQFILGREVGVSYYGTKFLKNDALLIPVTSTETQLVAYSSTKFDFPIIEYRPLRTFSLNQTSSLIFQISAGMDIPHSASVLSPVGVPVPELRPVYHIGMRLVFDWRKYF
jgi:hypothetical protein